MLFCLTGVKFCVQRQTDPVQKGLHLLNPLCDTGLVQDGFDQYGFFVTHYCLLLSFVICGLFCAILAVFFVIASFHAGKIMGYIVCRFTHKKQFYIKMII